MHILVIQLRQLGDILLTTPCLKAIKAAHPNARVSFFCHQMGSLVLKGNPNIDSLMMYTDHSKLIEQLRLLQQIRARKFDIVFDFMNNPRSALVSWYSGAPKRVCFDSVRRWAYTDVISNRHDAADYIVREKFLLLQKLGIPAGDIRPDIPLSDSDYLVAKKYLADHPLASKLKVILSPTHRRTIRRWPLENYAKLSDFLSQHHGALVTWLWGPGEEGDIDEGLKLCANEAYKAPKTSFREMAALVSLHDLFIGNSNGPSHVAVAVGTSSLQLHGHTSAQSWCPLSDLHQAIQSTLQFSDPEHAMAAITLDQVIAKTSKMLDALSNKK